MKSNLFLRGSTIALLWNCAAHGQGTPSASGAALAPQAEQAQAATEQSGPGASAADIVVTGSRVIGNSDNSLAPVTVTSQQAQKLQVRPNDYTDTSASDAVAGSRSQAIDLAEIAGDDVEANFRTSLSDRPFLGAAAPAVRLTGIFHLAPTDAFSIDILHRRNAMTSSGYDPEVWTKNDPQFFAATNLALTFELETTFHQNSPSTSRASPMPSRRRANSPAMAGAPASVAVIRRATARSVASSPPA